MSHIKRMSFILMIVATVLLAGCGSDARSQTSTVDSGTASGQVGHILDSIGSYATWIGGIAMAVSAIVFAATFIPIVQPIIAGLAAFGLTRKVIAEAGIIAFGMVLLGMAFLYLGHHTWLLVTAIGFIAVALAIRYHTWLATHLYPSPQVVAGPTATITSGTTVTKV
jgi:hypothetical protein